MQYGFVIDTKRCIGCHTCAVACRYENNVAKDIWWNRILTDDAEYQDMPKGEFPNAKVSYTPFQCQHCEKPACVDVCPAGATFKDPDTGVVKQDNKLCIGCKLCVEACPYTGVRTYIEKEPEYYTEVTFGDIDAPEHPANVVEKCTMCDHRLARDEEPACIKVCPARARIWGDLDDANSDVSKALADRDNKQLNPEAGTNPSVYYLI